MHRSKNTAGKKGNQNNSPPRVVDETHSGNGVMVVHCKPSLGCGFTVTGYMENQHGSRSSWEKIQNCWVKSHMWGRSLWFSTSSLSAETLGLCSHHRWTWTWTWSDSMDLRKSVCPWTLHRCDVITLLYKNNWPLTFIQTSVGSTATVSVKSRTSVRWSSTVWLHTKTDVSLTKAPG